jgi:hypothetical protein
MGKIFWTQESKPKECFCCGQNIDPKRHVTPTVENVLIGTDSALIIICGGCLTYKVEITEKINFMFVRGEETFL